MKEEDFIEFKIRSADILNAVLIFRIPYYISSILFGIPAVKHFNENIVEQLKDIEHLHLETYDLLVAMIFGMSILLFMGWALTLLVMGFRTATNAKTATHYILLFIALILAEIASKLLLYII